MVHADTPCPGSRHLGKRGIEIFKLCLPKCATFQSTDTFNNKLPFQLSATTRQQRLNDLLAKKLARHLITVAKKINYPRSEKNPRCHIIRAASLKECEVKIGLAMEGGVFLTISYDEVRMGIGVGMVA